MSKNEITAVGIDVSKGKSTVAVRRPGGEIVMMPFVVLHTAEDLAELTNTLRSIGGEIRVVMEHTGMYWRPIALALKEAGFFVSVVNATTTLFRMPNGFMVLPATRLPRLLRMIAPSCSLRKL